MTVYTTLVVVFIHGKGGYRRDSLGLLSRDERITGWPEAGNSRSLIRFLIHIIYSMSDRRVKRFTLVQHSEEPLFLLIGGIECIEVVSNDFLWKRKSSNQIGSHEGIRTMNSVMVSMLAYVAGVKARLTGDEKGATAVEYGIMVALIAVVIIAAVALIGTNLNAIFNQVALILGGV